MDKESEEVERKAQVDYDNSDTDFPEEMKADGEGSSKMSKNIEGQGNSNNCQTLGQCKITLGWYHNRQL